MVATKKLKFGSGVKYKGKRYFVTDVGVRVVKARRVYEKSAQYPNGRLGNLIESLKIKDLR